MIDSDEVYADDEPGAEKSKSQIKREYLALQDLGKEIVALTPGDLKRIPLSEEMHGEVMAARSLKMGALKRQLKHIGKLMHDEDVAAIHEALAALRQPTAAAVVALHRVEDWRDRLVAGDDALLEQLINDYPDVDRQHLRQLVRNARKEKSLDKTPKSARLLFKYLQTLDVEALP